MLTSFSPLTDGFFETGFQVHNWVMERARACFEADRQRRRRVRDAASFEAYRRERQDGFLASLGGLPDERCGLEPLETGRLRRRGYEVRKLTYQSLPSVRVSGLLYVPEGLARPAAGVLVGCGHHKDGKASPAYQRVCIDLVRAGFVVLIIDSPGQGEMVQCLRPGSAEPLVGLNTVEHSYLQLSASIVGQNIARQFVWNAVRGIDLLASLPEVDAARLGVTGNSGGGTLTQYLMMADPRVAAAMPCCSLASRETYLATGVRAYDGEQNLFGAIPRGLDYADLLAAFAPRPVRVGAAEYDFFAIEGVLDAVEEARGVYRALGAEGAIDLCVAEGEGHGYTTPLRRGCVAWLTRHLQGREAEPFTDEPEVESPEALRCTGTGQVLTEFSGARSMLDLQREAWASARRGAAPVTREELAAAIVPAERTPIRARRTAREVGPGAGEHGVAERVFYFSEPGIVATAVVYLPPTPPERAALLLIPDGTRGQEPFAGAIRGRVAAGQAVMVLDVRGVGAVKMHERNAGVGLSFRSTEFRVANDHFQLGTSLAAKRAYDVLRGLEYLRGRPEVAPGTPIELVGHGWPAIYGLLAAAVDGAVERCCVDGVPASWAEAFELRPPEPERIAEPLILPEFAGRLDVPDLFRLAQAEVACGAS